MPIEGLPNGGRKRAPKGISLYVIEKWAYDEECGMDYIDDYEFSINWEMIEKYKSDWTEAGFNYNLYELVIDEQSVRWKLKEDSFEMSDEFDSYIDTEFTVNGTPTVVNTPDGFPTLTITDSNDPFTTYVVTNQILVEQMQGIAPNSRIRIRGKMEEQANQCTILAWQLVA